MHQCKPWCASAARITVCSCFVYVSVSVSILAEAHNRRYIQPSPVIGMNNKRCFTKYWCVHSETRAKKTIPIAYGLAKVTQRMDIQSGIALNATH